LIASLLLFKSNGDVADVHGQPWLWGVGLLFGAVVGAGVRRWGSGKWRDVALGVAGTAVSFAIALAILKAHGQQADKWQIDVFPRLGEVLAAARDPRLIALSATAGILFAAGMIVSYDPRRLGRWIIWLLAVLLGVTSAVGLACLQIVLVKPEPITTAVTLLCVLAGTVYTAGTALALKPQRGKFHGFGAATGAVCIGLLMPICFAVFLYVKHHGLYLNNAPLMYGLGAMWFAAFGAQLGFCFSYYVREHRRWQPQDSRRPDAPATGQ
jgi:hypothetical protein